MITPILDNDLRAHGPAQTLRDATPGGGRTKQSAYLETPTDALEAMAARAPGDALDWFTGYVRRRDRVLAAMAAEEFQSVLETLATEFRREAAAEPASPNARGLSLAAAVVSDTAAAIRAGIPHKCPAGET